MKFVWYVIPRPESNGDQGNEKPVGGSAQKPEVLPPRVKMSEIGGDLNAFIAGSEGLKPQERQEFSKKAREWDQSRNVTEMRRGGISAAENEKDPLKKHEVLASLFLERDKKTQSKMSFNVDFKDNGLGEDYVGAGDLMPITAKVIRVQYAGGPPKYGSVIERAVRAINPANKRIGYYEENALKRKVYQYVPVFSGTQIDVVETQSSESRGVALQMMAENITMYNPPKRERSASTPASFVRGPQAPGRAPQAPRNVASRPTASPASTPTAIPAGAPAGSPERAETAADRKRIVDAARRYIGVPREEFRSADVNGGVLACAKVASTILKEAGFLEQVELGVDQTVEQLKDHGWTVSREKPEPGDVIIWSPLGRANRGAVDDSGPKYQLSHKHIGIAVSPTTAVNNNSAQAMPVESPIYARPVEAILKPPGAPKKPSSAETPDGIANHLTRDMNTIASDHAFNAQKMKITPEAQRHLEKFRERAMANRGRYENVSAVTGIPWELIAALHERESGGNFNTYLHNGDPLGKPTVHVPKGKLFYDWETATIDALNSKKTGIKADARDMGSLLAYAERYNGLGYRNPNIGRPSPYVYAGTNIYQGGKYVRDGVYDPNAWDQQLGVASMLVALMGPEDYGPTDKNRAVA